MIGCIKTSDFTIWHTPLDSAVPAREAEKRAVETLCVAALGCDARIVHTPEGAPRVEGSPEILISITHCQGLCAMAVASLDHVEALGIDAETMRPSQLRKISRRFLHSEEAERSLDDSALRRYWTIKEAVYKAALTPGLSLNAILADTALKMATANGSEYNLDYYELADVAITVAYALKAP